MNLEEKFVKLVMAIAVDNGKLKSVDEAVTQIKKIRTINEIPKKFLTNKLSAKGYSLNGFSEKVLISAVQQYARRGDLNNLIYFGVEYYSMRFANGRNFLENFKNLCLSIVLKEIGALNIKVVLEVGKNLESLTDAAEPFPPELFSIFVALAGTNHYKIHEHITNYFEKSTMVLETSGPKNKNLRYDLEEDKKLIFEVDSFLGALENKSSDIFYWIEEIHKKTKNGLKSERFGEKSFSSLIFSLYRFFFTRVRVNFGIEDLSDKCHYWSKRYCGIEKLLLYTPAYAIIFEESISWNSDIYNYNFPKNYFNYFSRNLSNEKVELDNHVFDHTTGNIGKDESDFAVQSSVAAFEDGYFSAILSDFEEFYVAENINKGKLKSESELFVSNTAIKAKIFKGDSHGTYYAEYLTSKTGKRIVVKGPMSREKAFDIYNIHRFMSLFRGVNTLKIDKIILKNDLFPVGTANPRGDYFILMEDARTKTSETKKYLEIYNYHYDETLGIADYKKLHNKGLPLGDADYILTANNFNLTKSLILQLGFLYALNVGSVSAKNFVLVGDRAYFVSSGKPLSGKNNIGNLDKKVAEFLITFYENNKKDIIEIFLSWYDSFDIEMNGGNSLVASGRWYMLQRTFKLKNEDIESIKLRIDFMSDDLAVIFT